MAVCRKARCAKLTVIAIILTTLLYNLYPEELRNFLSQSGPPSEVHEAAESRGAGQDEADQDSQPRNNEVMMRHHQRGFNS